MTTETIGKELYIIISKCFLMLYLGNNQEQKIRNKKIKETFSILEKTIITGKKISIWYNQVSDFSIKTFIWSNIQNWIHVLDKTSQLYARTLLLLRTLKYERTLKIDSIVYNQDDDYQIIKTKCLNCYQLFLEIKNYSSNTITVSSQENDLIEKIKSFLILILKKRKAPESAYYLAMIFNYDKTEVSIWKTQKYLKASDTLGSPEGCFQLANNYYRGTIIQKSYSEAFRLYQKSGELGFHEAFYNAGIMAEEGLGTEVNIELSKKLFFKSISNQHSSGIYKLKELWDRFPETLPMYITCSGKGFHEFTDYLSTMYYYGIYIEDERDRARELWIKGYQESSNLEFLKRLEVSFQEYPQDLEDYKIKSEQGEHEYTWRLGFFYKKGICGFEQNNAMAHKFWYKGSCSNHLKCHESLVGVPKEIQINQNRDLLEKTRLAEMINQKDLGEQTRMIFEFLEFSFDYLHENLNLMMESSTKLSQEYLIIRLFKVILATKEITEEVLLNWYLQYSNKDFINLAHYYWKYLLGVKIETSDYKLKNFLNIISVQQCCLRRSYLKTDPDFEESNKRCVPISKSLQKEILSLKCHEDKENLLKTNYRINGLIDKMIFEDRKTNNEWCCFYLGLLLIQLTNNNLRYLSLAFFYLFKSSYFNNPEAKFNLGIMCYHSELLEPNYNLSKEFLVSSLKDGYKNSCFPLGFLHYNQPNQKNNDLAYQYWFQGVLYGNTNCMYILKILSESLNLSKFKNMIQNGVYNLCYEVGIMLKFGISTPKNENESLSYWFLGLEKNITSCVEPIRIYFQENTSRLKWYKKVSNNGNEKYSKRWNLILKYKIHHLM